MGLPVSRYRTNAPGSQVFSADLNGIQDQLIDLPRFYHAAGGYGADAVIVPGSGWLLSQALGRWWIPLPLRIGSKLWKVTLHGNDTGGALTVTPYRISTAGVRTTIPGFSVSPSCGAWSPGTGASTTAAAYTIAAGYFHYAHIDYDSTGLEFAGVEVELTE